MSWLKRFREKFGIPQPSVVNPTKPIAERKSMSISDATALRFKALGAALKEGMPIAPQFPIKCYKPPQGIAPEGVVLAMDSTFSKIYADSTLQMQGTGFPGYAFLTELTQITEYRDMSERLAAEMVRKWIKFRSVSNTDQSQYIKQIEQAFKRLKVRDTFRDAVTRDGWFGSCKIFMDFGVNKGDELKTPILFNKYKIPEGSLRGIKLVEPISTYPAQYNSANPLAADYYKPSSWFVYSQQVHETRMLSFVSRPVPDLLKPAYNFGGISVSQLAMPYVDYWLSTRSNVSEILRNFRTTVFETDMSDALADQGSGDNTIKRLQMFAAARDNFGVFCVDASKGEKVQEINTPLSGLKELQAAAQEHMAAVAKMPLVVMLGVSPTGLNSSTEGEMRAWDDHVHDQQELMFRTPLDTLLRAVMLSEFGEILEDITFDFEPLVEMSEKERALIRKSDAEAGSLYIQEGVVDPKEERQRLADDPTSGYNNLNVSRMPVAPSPEMVAQLSKKSDASSSAENGAREGVEFGASDEAKILSDMLHDLSEDVAS